MTIRGGSLRALVVTLSIVTLASCFEEDPPATDGGVGTSADGGADAGALPGPSMAAVAYGGDSIWDAPWPDERLRSADGTVDVSGFHNLSRPVTIVTQLLALLRGAPGFGNSSTIFFPLSAPIDASSLPADAHASLADDATVYLIDVDATSPDRGSRHPFVARFDTDPGPFAVPNTLALLPLQGRPLHPGRLYAAVLTTHVLAADGSALQPAQATTQLVNGQRPDGLSDAAFAAHQDALSALGDLGVATDDIAAMAVFRTMDPTAELAQAREQVLAGTIPTPDAAFEAREVFDDFCVYHTTIAMPDFQGGTPPFTSEGGAWVRDAAGNLAVQRQARSNVWVTIPRQPMPDAGFPTVVFVRTGGGGDRPLVDRGPDPQPHAGATPGTGPALHFAQAGFVGISVDGPLGGQRNTDGWDEQFAIFNIQNPEGLRDNIRQSALELMLLAHVLPSLSVDASGCPDFSTPAGDGLAKLDASTLALMGHSMGATIAPLVVALEPAYDALILSGAGGSWIENVMFKMSPIEVRPAADLMLGYSTRRREVTEHDPVLALLQWAGESADPQVYARNIITEPLGGAAPRDVLMFQGILDTYIPPPVANALSLALGIDLGGMELDTTVPQYQPLSRFLDISGGARITLPVAGNRDTGSITGVVVQHPADGIEDGHEVVFQSPGPQLQYRCFLESLRLGVPRVPSSDGTTCE